VRGALDEVRTWVEENADKFDVFAPPNEQ